MLDSCVWAGALDLIQAEGHDAIWCGQWDADPGDEEIIRRAFEDGRVLVTLDKDFGELAVVKGMGHAGIIRLAGISAREQGPTCLAVLSKYEAELTGGAIITVTPKVVRVRPGDRE